MEKTPPFFSSLHREIFDDVGGRPELSWRNHAKIHAHLRSASCQRERDVVPAITDKGHDHVGQVFVGKLAHCHEVGKDLGRMRFIRQAVIDGDACEFRKVLH